MAKSLFLFGSPNGVRTRVFGVRGQTIVHNLLKLLCAILRKCVFLACICNLYATTFVGYPSML